MRIDVHNRETACGMDPVPGTVIISISGPGNPAPLRDGWDDVLRLEFHDVVRPIPGMQELVLFGPDHVDAIHEFVERHVAAGSDFVVHCDAGVSRSVAVGLFLQEVHGGSLHSHIVPLTHVDKTANARVKRGLMRKHWEERLR